MIAQPWNLIFLMLFYGLADLLIREALIRRHLGWVSLIIFGIAFGFLNEGVLAGTWYTVKPDGYIYIGQINYAWAAALTVFHIFISVIAPIAFIETIFPSLAGMPLLRRRRGIVISAVIFLLVTCLFIFLPSYRLYRSSSSSSRSRWRLSPCGCQQRVHAHSDRPAQRRASGSCAGRASSPC